MAPVHGYAALPAGQRALLDAITDDEPELVCSWCDGDADKLLDLFRQLKQVAKGKRAQEIIKAIKAEMEGR